MQKQIPLDSFKCYGENSLVMVKCLNSPLWPAMLKERLEDNIYKVKLFNESSEVYIKQSDMMEFTTENVKVSQMEALGNRKHAMAVKMAMKELQRRKRAKKDVHSVEPKFKFSDEELSKSKVQSDATFSIDPSNGPSQKLESQEKYCQQPQKLKDTNTKQQLKDTKGRSTRNPKAYSKETQHSNQKLTSENVMLTLGIAHKISQTLIKEQNITNKKEIFPQTEIKVREVEKKSKNKKNNSKQNIDHVKADLIKIKIEQDVKGEQKEDEEMKKIEMTNKKELVYTQKSEKINDIEDCELLFPKTLLTISKCSIVGGLEEALDFIKDYLFQKNFVKITCIDPTERQLTQTQNFILECLEIQILTPMDLIFTPILSKITDILRIYQMSYHKVCSRLIIGLVRLLPKLQARVSAPLSNGRFDGAKKQALGHIKKAESALNNYPEWQVSSTLMF